jgi:hypothetical protein
MSRRSKPPNRHGCKPDGDVCVKHDTPLECRHGCKHATEHKCQCAHCRVNGVSTGESGTYYQDGSPQPCGYCGGSGRAM